MIPNKYRKGWVPYNIAHHIQQTNISEFGRKEKLKMVKLSDEAKNYVPPTTKNISELDSVPVDCEIFEKEVPKKDGGTFTYKFIEVNGEEYRVGAMVLSQLKVQLEGNPTLTHFTVVKEGEGMKTNYTVVPK